MIKKLIWLVAIIASFSFTNAAIVTSPQVDFTFGYLRDSLPTSDHKNYVHYSICQNWWSNIAWQNLRATVAFYQQGKLLARKPWQLFNQWWCMAWYINIHKARACDDSTIYAVIESDIDTNRQNNRSQNLQLRKLSYDYPCWLDRAGWGWGGSTNPSYTMTANDYDYRIENIRLLANNNAKIQVCRTIIDPSKNFTDKRSTASFVFSNGWRSTSNTHFFFTKDHECKERTLNYSSLVAPSNNMMNYMIRWIIQHDDANPSNNTRDVWLADTRPTVDPYYNPHTWWGNNNTSSSSNSSHTTNHSNGWNHQNYKKHIDLSVGKRNFVVTQQDVLFDVCVRGGSYNWDIEIGVGGKYITRYYNSYGSNGCSQVSFPLSMISDIHQWETVRMKAMVKLPSWVSSYEESNYSNNSYTDPIVLIPKYADAAAPTVDNYCYYGQGELCSRYTPSQNTWYGNSYVWNGWLYNANSWSGLYGWW